MATRGGSNQIIHERTRASQRVPHDRFRPFTAAGVKVAEVRDTISEVGLLLPVVACPHDDGTWSIVDGHARATAIRLLAPDVTVPVVVAYQPTEHVVHAAALHRAVTQHRAARSNFLPLVPVGTVPTSRKTLERVLHVVGVAADPTLPLQVRLIAAEGVTRLADGEPVARIHRLITEAATTAASTYPELAHLPADQAQRLTAHLDGMDPDEREGELAAIRLATHQHPHPAAMALFTALSDLDRAVTGAHLDEVLRDALEAGVITAPLRERAQAIAARLEQHTHLIRQAAGGVREVAAA